MKDWMKFSLGLLALAIVALLGLLIVVGVFFNPMEPKQQNAAGQPASPTPTNMPTPAPAVPAAGQAAAPAQPQFGVVEPQPYVPHPSSYQETGTQGTITWTINVPADTTLVYGGFAINDESNGVYGAIQGPSTVTLTVTDGFYSVVKNEWAEQEYCFRLSQAKQHRWAHTHLHPLPGWSCP